MFYSFHIFSLKSIFNFEVIIMFNKEKKEAKKIAKESKKAMEEAKRQEKIRESEKRIAERKEKMAERKEKIAEIDAHNKQVLKDTFSDIKQIRQQGKQQRLNIINDAIHEGRIARGEEGLYQENPSSQTDITSELQKFKQLVEDGLITAEEFEAKKKQLLGL